MQSNIQQTVDYYKLLDSVELQMHQSGLVKIEPISVFSPGIYTRSIIVPAGVYLLSHVHKTEHQFIMSAGQIVIYTPEKKMMFYSAPYLGKTYPQTVRLAKTITNVTWTSIHSTNISPKNKSKKALKEAVKLVEKELYEKRENILLIKLNQEPCQQLPQPL